MNSATPLVYAVAMAAALGAATLHAAAPTVGEVTLTIGQSTLLSDDGTEVRLARGALVRPGDRIETAAGGHVHIRFLDGALVSVRPFSRLVVEEYTYNAAQAEKSQVRFKLEKGSTRAISGAAAEQAKERFRLNTPLVAIGVRGTDFTVQTDQQLTLAAVSQGAIVVAPLGDGCTAQSYGPCSTQAARFLSADMEGLLAEFRNGLSQPELRSQFTQTALAAPATTQSGGERTAAPLPGTGPDAADSRALAALRQELISQTGAATPPEAPAATLVWGRWGEPRPGDDFTLPREQARTQGEAVVHGWPYSLYRQHPDNPTWPSTLGKVGFGLQAASVQYQNGGTVTPAAVAGGQLTVDFAASRYTTQLQLDGVPYVLRDFSAAGVINPSGVFENRSANQSISGAVTFDGRAAGYLFQKASSVGLVNGITLWSR